MEMIDSPYWLLFDMQDPEPERYSLAREHPEVLAQMIDLLAQSRAKFDPLRTREPVKVIP